MSILRQKTIIHGLATLLLLGLSTGCFSTSSPVVGSGEDEYAATGSDQREHASARVEESEQSAVPRCVSAEDAERLADQALQLVNLERAAAEGELAPVVVDPTLSRIAGDYACRMVEQGFFDHVDPITGHGPGERAVAGRYSYYAVGENLAAGATTAAEVVKLWMDSPPHRAIILDAKWTEVGIAVRTGSDGSIYWVQEFGDPAPSLPENHDAHE